MTTDTAEAARFDVRLDNFEGPFDLLLNLIAKHKLDITEVALSKVTDEFIVHVKAAGAVWDLEQTTSFLLVASTLLDLKAARLLPQGDVEDEEDLALLELFREGAVGFDQVTPMGELSVRWTGADDAEIEITDEFDGTPLPMETPAPEPETEAAPPEAPGSEPA